VCSLSAAVKCDRSMLMSGLRVRGDLVVSERKRKRNENEKESEKKNKRKQKKMHTVFP